LELLVQSPETYFDFGRKVAAGDLDLAQRELAAAERIFDKAVSPLAEQPDQEVVEEWLRKARTWAAYGMIR
jgi:hypothetical protein